ncbi:MAG: hypothetical protein CMA79_02805 [Euryarchaeota archaeon]|nr:hypothetical protein [Euryarchaeota archaeon]MBN55349.1 hypothetical protein [Euryarchaeota archaeon]|tara:strand:+ start:650 stop:1213 length:564 start_codon:yes stop_codon:yes gene_type:complete
MTTAEKLNSSLARKLHGYLSKESVAIDSNLDTLVEEYESAVMGLFEWQDAVHSNAENWYSGNIGRRPVYEISSILMVALSMMLPDRRRSGRAIQFAEEVGAGDQVANAHLATMLSNITGLSMPCLLAVREWDDEGYMVSSHTLVEDSGGTLRLSMFGRGVALSLLEEGIELEEEILMLLSPFDDEMA